MKNNKVLKKFNVLYWNFNSDKLEPYDVLPYFRNRYKDRVDNLKKKRKTKWWGKATDEEKQDYLKYWFVPNDFESFKKFIESESQYQFWARCEYEMICHGWPARKNEHKLDIHEQIMMNIDIIAEILLNEYTEK